MDPQSMSGRFVGDENLSLNSTSIPLVQSLHQLSYCNTECTVSHCQSELSNNVFRGFNVTDSNTCEELKGIYLLSLTAKYGTEMEISKRKFHLKL